MQANYVQRLRIVFSKLGPTRYIGHLDMARTLERAFNRARIPLAYTQGYNRRPRMQIAAALPLGFTSECEIADIWLAERIEPGNLKSRLESKMAPGIVVHSVEDVELSAPALQTVTSAARYRAVLANDVDCDELRERIETLLAADTVPRERRGKVYDLRPLILTIDLKETVQGTIQLDMHLLLEPSRTGRPDEVLRALRLDPLTAHIHRTKIILQAGNRGL